VPDLGKPILTVVIPALNEEEAIGDTIQRCLDAREHIREEGGVSDVEIVVVSDGSTDRTPQIAQEFADRDSSVRVVVFEENQGYGAAIKEGFRVGRGDLVGFLDADGTCDPRFFADLCAALADADVALGGRLGPNSRMPAVRRLGNRIFALLLGFLSGEAVTDTASGMRVLKRAALTYLEPLPNGLDFTPAMSARAMMQRLRIVEIPMPYDERIGRSKLKAFEDGVRFLRAILDAVLFFYPSRLFTLGTSLCALVVLVLAISPAEFYLRNRYLEEWMIYRFVVCLLLAVSGFVLLCSAVVADELFFLTNRRRRWTNFSSQVLATLFSQRPLLILAAVATPVSLLLVWPGLLEYARTRHVTLHWSRVIAAAFGLIIALQCVVTASLQRLLGLWRSHLSLERTAPRAPRTAGAPVPEVGQARGSTDTAESRPSFEAGYRGRAGRQ
jgi:glycosyltransferase involved in cell wall biosynthesis